MVRCKQCGRKIDFVRMEGGRNMPVEEYLLLCVLDKFGDRKVIVAGKVCTARQCAPGDKEQIWAHVLHWPQCRGADAIKRKQAAKRQAAGESAPKRRRADRQQAAQAAGDQISFL